MRSKVFQTEGKDLKESLSKIFKTLNLKDIVKERIILKPNLTTKIPYPITTDPKFVEVLVELIFDFFKGEILIAEGSGGCDTKEAFKRLGWEKISKKFGIKLVDLNREERIKFENKNALKLKEVWLPKILFSGYLISLPVPKEHGEAIFTCALKNQIGIYLSKDFVKEYDKEMLEKKGIFVAKEIWERGWNKGELHFLGINETIFDLHLYRKPDLVICDGRVGVKGGELGGKEFETGKIFASFDPVALDSHLAKIFGFDWRKIKYLVLANKVLGEADNYEVLNL
jgi:uncharacterized protein (DUF362 family)